MEVLLFLLLIIGTPIYFIIKILAECHRAIIDDKNKDIVTRKRNVQKIARFIKDFNKDTVFGNYVIENDNITVKVIQEKDKTRYVCKNKTIENGKIQVIKFSQKLKTKSVKRQNYFEWLNPPSEIFEDICNNFDENTDMKKMKELLDMGNMPFEENFINK